MSAKPHLPSFPEDSDLMVSVVFQCATNWISADCSRCAEADFNARYIVEMDGKFLESVCEKCFWESVKNGVLANGVVVKVAPGAFEPLRAKA